MSKVNLDIKKKVNSPADNGSAGQLLRTNGDGSTSWINIPNDEQVKDSVNEYLRDNFSNPSSPPLDRTLSSPDAAAAADAVGAFKSVMGDYVMDYTETIEVDPHQLWNKDVVNAEPYLTENKIGINTSTRIAYAYNKARIYAIEINGELGDLFTFNLLNSKTFADFNVTSAELYASNIIPVDGSTLLQRGVTGWSYYRATISLTQPSKYLIIALQCSTSDIDENKADCDAFMSNVVVRKGNYDTTYYDYVERTVITPDYHVVKSDFGRGNAGRMLIIGGNGKVTTGTIVDPQVSDGVGYYPLQSVHVGEDLISNVTDISLGEGWSGDLTNGLVHEKGEESSVVLSIPLTANTQYLMTFNASSHYEESLFVAFGDDDDIDVYTSESFKAVGFISDGENKIKIRAVSGLGVTITNVALYELQPNGTEMILDAKNVNHGSTQSNISGFWNVAIGDETTQTNNVSGTRNIAIGLSSQYRLQQGNRNIAIGTFSMPFVKEGERNVAIGADALYSGEHRLSDNRAYDNVAIGKAAMHDGSLIQRNVAIGSRAMKDSDSQATDNTVVGFQAGNYAHNYNTIVGKRAGYYTKGDHNTALGWEAGGDLYVSGTGNVSIGSLAGFDKTGASAASPKLMNNTITVGYGVKAEASNEARFGNTDQKVFLAGKEIVFNEGGFVTWGDNDASGDIAEALADWLEQHPEAVTTVEDGSITREKLHATVNRDIQDIKDDLEETQNALGLIGSLTDYGTTHPLVINDVAGTYVDLEFSTATSFLQAGKNLYPNSIDTFTRTKTVMLPMTYPAGTYVFSSYVTSTDTDKTFCWVGFSNGTNYVTPFTQGIMYRDQRTECVMTPSGAFDRIVLFASDDYGHSASDDAVFSNTQLDWGSEPSNYIPYNGLVRSVTDRIVLAHDYTILISNDGSDIHASSRNGSREPIIPQLENELSALTPYASQSDVGKFLKLKSASEGKATSYEYGTVAALDDNAGTGDVDRTWSANKLSKIKSDVTNVKQELGLEGQPINYGTRHPLKIEDSPGVIVDLEFTTAESYLISNRNLIDAGTKTFTRTKVCQLPMELPAGTYTFSAGIQSNDTDSTKCQVNFQKDGVSVGYKNINRGERVFDVITATGPFTNVVLTSSDTYGHAAGDTATFTDMQLEWGDLVTDYIQYDGHIREVANINSITLEYPQTYIFTNDKSEIHGSSIAGDVHHYVADLQTAIEKMQSLKGKKIIAFGDSIWGNDRTYGVADYLAEYSGATIYNCAIGGTRVTGDRNQYEGPAYAPFDGMNLIRSLLDQDWTDQDANVDSVISYVKTQTLPLLKTINLSEMDIIVLAYGHNDFTAPRTIAQVQAAYNEVVSMILDEYPSKRIVIVAPPWRMFNDTDGDTYENSQGVTLRQMSDGIIAGAKAKHITCINMLDELPWRNETKQYYLDNDSVHPNVEGNKVYARVMCEKLRSMTSWSAVSTEDAIADGAISESKLDSELRNKLGEIEYKAPAIIGSVTDYRHENVEAFTMNGNQLAFGHARYADKKNLIIAEDKTFTASNVEVTISGGIAVLNGTNSGGADDRYFAQHEVDMPAGNYIFKIEPYAGSTTLSSGKNMHLDMWYDGNTSSTYDRRVTLSVNDTAQSSTFTTTSHVYKIRAWFGIRSSSTYTDYRLFYSLFPSNVTIVDTEETIEPLGTLYVTPENAMPVVDTMMHTSTIRTVVDTKTYIDNHTQDVDFVCFRPEDYGAKGDGIANDSAALQACINAAQAYSNETGVCIRGYGTYKLNTGVVFNCRELDVYINKIIYTGSDAAVQLSASFSRFEFQSIRAYTGGNNAVCIRCYQSLDSGYTTTFHSNVVTCSFMRSSGNCVEFAEASGLTQHTIMYNDFYCQYQRSDNANIFAVLSRLANETNCYGKYVCAQNGYLLYYDKTHGAGGTIRMFYYCLETDLQNGTNGEGRFYYCRFRELEDKQSTSDRTIGRIYKWDNTFPEGEIFHPTGGIDLTAVDVSNNCSWEDCLERVKDYFEENPSASSYDVFSMFIPISREPYAKFDIATRVANARLAPNNSMTTTPAGTMYVYYDNIAFKPYSSIYKLVDDDMTIQLTSSNGWTYLTPTTFDINTTSATITLDASYCCIAINEFDVIQHEGKTAIVVDKLGNTIFNGANRGPGRFHFKCDFVPYGHHEIYVTLDDSTVKYLNDTLLPSIYSGYNEQWSVTSYLEDGSVSYARLDTNLKGKIDDIDFLFEQTSGINGGTQDVTSLVSWTSGYSVQASTGTLHTKNNYSYADISLHNAVHVAGYTRAGQEVLLGMCFLTSTGSWISGDYHENAGTYDWNYSFDVPANAATLRICCATTKISDFTCTLTFEGSVGRLTDRIEDLEDIVDDVVLSDISYKWLDGYCINSYNFNNNDRGNYELTSGQSIAIANVQAFAGGYIKGHTRLGDGRGIAFYDGHGIFISGIARPSGADYDWDFEIAIPSGAKKVCISCTSSSKSGFVLKGTGIQKGVNNTRTQRSFEYVCPDDVYGLDNSKSDFHYDSQTRLQDIYKWFDILASTFPRNITRVTIGTTTTPTGSYATIDSNTYNIYGYVIQGDSYISGKDFIIASGIHGDESNGDGIQSVVSVAYFIRDMLCHPEKSEYLEYMKLYCKILVIPVMNPWGYQNGKRCNGRGVDLNRNWDYNFVADSESYGYTSGSEAFSEDETDAIKDYIATNFANALYCTELHTRGGNTLPSDDRWYTTTTSGATNMQNAVTDVGNYLRKLYGGSVSNGQQSTSELPPSFRGYLDQVIGVPTHLIECAKSVHMDITTFNSDLVQRQYVQYLGAMTQTLVETFVM